MFIDGDDTIWVLDTAGSLRAYLSDGTVLTPTHSGGSAVGPWGPYVTVWGITNVNGGYDEALENRAQAVHDGPNLYTVFGGGSPYAGGVAQDAYATIRQRSQPRSDRNSECERRIRSRCRQHAGAPYGVAVDSPNKRLYVAVPALSEVDVYSTIPPYKQLAIMH